MEIIILFHCGVFWDLQRKRLYRRHYCSNFTFTSIQRRIWCVSSSHTWPDYIYCRNARDNLFYSFFPHLCCVPQWQWLGQVSLLEGQGEVLYANDNWANSRLRGFQRFQWEAVRRTYHGGHNKGLSACGSGRENERSRQQATRSQKRQRRTKRELMGWGWSSHNSQSYSQS